MRIATFIPARMNSYRLQGKHLLKIKERECLAHLIDRVKLSKLHGPIFVCVPSTVEDGKLIDLAEREHVLWSQGSPNDILARYIGTTENFGIEFVVNVDGDDIFCDPYYLDRVVQRYLNTGCDVVQTCGLPFGVGCFGFKTSALRHLVENGQGGDTNWGCLFTQNRSFKVETVEALPEHRHPEMRFSLDTLEDYRFLSCIFEKLYRPGEVFGLGEIIDICIGKV